jgi:ferredoxin
MANLKELAKKILEDKSANLLIGYSNSPQGDIKPIFIAMPEMTEQLVYNEKCTQNLVAYLHKPEVKAYKTIAIVLNYPASRALLQLIAENQFKNISVLAIVVKDDGTAEVLNDVKQLEDYVKANFKKYNPNELDNINDIMNKSLDDRWNYWVDAVQDCIKCYACRSACPMCYCEKCTTDCNNPQWVATSTHTQGNIEWHIMRAMHLAGRCVNCNECARACPVDIPLNLLTRKINEDMEAQFDQVSGLSAELDYAMSSYKFEDKENFIR